MWPLGKFISDMLEARGGRQNGWTQSHLAKSAKISTGHLSWIIHGETSGKKGSPDIGMDTLIALAKALSIKEQTLIDAYKGENPDLMHEADLSPKAVEELLAFIAKHTHAKVLSESFIAVNGEVIEETKKLLKDGE
jgi:transcriptional regulator with XRE-family HTH domain